MHFHRNVFLLDLRPSFLCFLFFFALFGGDSLIIAFLSLPKLSRRGMPSLACLAPPIQSTSPQTFSGGEKPPTKNGTHLPRTSFLTTGSGLAASAFSKCPFWDAKICKATAAAQLSSSFSATNSAQLPLKLPPPLQFDRALPIPRTVPIQKPLRLHRPKQPLSPNIA